MKLKSSGFPPFYSPLLLVLFLINTLVALFPSCKALLPERELRVKAIPEEDYTVLETGSPAVLIFAEDVEPGSVESLAGIRRADDSLKLSFSWSGRRLELHPLETVIPGWEYRLELDGIYKNTKGLEREASLSRPFSWGSRDFNPLKVTGCVPEEGDSIALNDALYISFNSRPDDASLSRHLRISPHRELNKEWNGSTLILSADKGWDNLSSYRLELDGELCNGSGQVLAIPWTLNFYAEEGCSPPRIVRCAACGRDRSLGFPWILPAAEAPSYSQGIRISFSLPMDRDQTEMSFFLSPSLAGDLCWIDRAGGADLAFIPEEGFDMGTSYTLRISSSARSEYGIGGAEDYIKEFLPAIPLLTLDSLECVSAGGFTLYEYTELLPRDLPVKSPSPYDLLFRFRFSRPFTGDSEKQSVQEGITLYERFSAGGSPYPGLYAWESDSILTILYSGFRADSDSEYYYLLELAGGTGGIRNGEGGYLKEDIRQLLRVPRQ